MSGYRILVTGSRDWTDRDALWAALWDAWSDVCEQDEWTVLVHGDCPTGADQMAAQMWRLYSGTEPETHPADFKTRGRRAGPERNAAMVALGATICVAAIGPCTSPRCHRSDIHASHGATGCADLAEAAGIPTRRIYAAELFTAPDRGSEASE